MIVRRIDGDVGEGGVLGSAVEVDGAGRAVDYVAGMKNFKRAALQLVVADAIGGDEDLAGLVAVPAVVGAFGEGDIGPRRGAGGVWRSEERAKVHGVIEIWGLKFLGRLAEEKFVFSFA